MLIVIRTKKIAEYFTGEIKKGYFPMDNPSEKYYVECLTYAGGGRQVSPLEVIHYKSMSYNWLKDRLKKFAKRNNYILEFSRRQK